MAFLTLEKIPSGETIFIDSSIFIYHFTGASLQCRQFLERCERNDAKGITSVLALAEVAHRLMMMEAMQAGVVAGNNLPRKLRGMPEAVKKLHLYQEQIEKIPLMGIHLIPVDATCLFQSIELRRKYGLLVNDSLIAASAILQSAAGIASADSDFARVAELSVFHPTDLLNADS